MTTTPGRQFFEEHMAYLAAKDIEGMVNKTYTENAILYNAFPCLDVPPPNVCRGRQAIIELFQVYLDYQGDIQVDTLYNFLETEDTISFQGIITSPNTGKWVVGDVWLMESGQIARHFGFAHKM